MESVYERESNYHRKVVIVYLVVFTIMLGMIITNIATFGENKTNYGLGSYESLTSGWVDEEGNAFNFMDGRNYVKGQETQTMYYQIPSDIESEESLVFRTKSARVRVFIGENLVYTTDIKKGPFQNNSPGIRWNVVTYNEKDAGSQIRMEITLAYLDGSSKVDHMYKGDRAAIIVNLIKSKGFSLLVCLLMFMIGVLYYFMGIMLNHRQKEKDYSLIYLGSFAIIIAVWCLIETNILQFFINNIRLLQIIGNMVQLLAAVPFFLYMDCMYQTFQYRMVRMLCMLDLIYIGAGAMLHIAGMLDLNQMLDFMIIGYGVIMTVFLLHGIRYNRRYRKSGKSRIRERGYLVKLMALMGLWFCIIMDLLCYLFSNTLDYARFTRVGLIGFILLFGFDNISRLTDLIKQGFKTELISSLAYTDGLTKIGNRTAYMEEVERISEKLSGQCCGIAMFDINNLKQVNDEHGHAAGDHLIKTCAELLRDVFAGIGEVYRIGGDEFVVIMTGYDVVHLYEQATLELQKRLRKLPEVSIAYGAAYCTEVTLENLHETERKADQKMYQNKHRVKKEQNR